MPYKSCPDCGQTSFSSSGTGIWICPCCGLDLSREASLGALGRGRLLYFSAPPPPCVVRPAKANAERL